MNPLQYMKMLTSFHEGWDEISRIHPTVAKTFFLLVLPLSLLPPAMLLFAGSNHPEAYLMNAPLSRWEAVAAIFLLTELLTVPLMGWVIRNIADTYKIECDFKDTFLLAAIAAIPLWVSSLALAVPNLWVVLVVLPLGLLASASMLYHGTTGILNIEDEEETQALSSAAFSVGGLIWAFLCAFVVLPLMT